MITFNKVFDVIQRKFNNDELTFEEARTLIEDASEKYEIENDFTNGEPVFCSLEEFLDYYGLEEDTSYVEESLGSSLRKLSSEKYISKVWNSKKQSNSTYESDGVSDKNFQKIKESFDGMKNADTYRVYKKNFDNVCRLCGISNVSIIVTYDLKKGEKPNKNYVKIVFNNNKQKIIIPNGYSLYHRSTMNNIDKRGILPFFKGKVAKGYLYDTPRVYLTLRKKMIKFAADIKQTDKTYLYEVTENISSAYVDPLLPSYSFGAIYVETNSPIPCKKVIPESIKKESVIDTFIESGIIPIDDEILDEYLSEGTIDKISIKMHQTSDIAVIRREWEKLADSFEKKHKSMVIPNKETKDKLIKAYDTLKKEKISYLEYKINFDYICKYMKLNPKSTLLENIDFDKKKNDNTEYINVRYASGRKAVIIPNGTQLIHVSPVNNLTELKPSFRSKTIGKYMYPSNRVFFTMSKPIPVKKAGLEKKTLSIYTPEKNFKVGYIDPSYTDYKTGSIYIDTNVPIEVTKIK